LFAVFVLLACVQVALEQVRLEKSDGRLKVDCQLLVVRELLLYTVTVMVYCHLPPAETMLLV